MPNLRPFLVAVQSIAYQLATTPPNKTPEKARYDGNHSWSSRIAPAVMQLQRPLVWLCTFAEISIALARPLTDTFNSPVLSDVIQKLVHTSAPIYTTRIAVIGTSLVVFGSLIRLACYRTLGQLFTFDLTIFPKHTLVTNGPYAYVRHPAYTGSLCMILGLELVNLTPGSWLAETGVLGRSSLALALRLIVGTAWWAWWWVIGVRRCRSEDAELRKTFGKQWDEYARRVRYWFIPGVL